MLAIDTVKEKDKKLSTMWLSPHPLIQKFLNPYVAQPDISRFTRLDSSGNNVAHAQLISLKAPCLNNDI